ncbi:DUF5672 family protein [Sphingomonas daechungensis]|uniref:DUF5672 family protein n=1 Tax=Sphingomonas daechungensis TaxID=1176646 RepID=UPI001CB99B7E|nr:DUF5672 family protein [Sphingomonas daechungensis]
MKICLDRIDFADCLLFGAADHPVSDSRIRLIDGPLLKSGAEYSEFVLRGLGEHVMTSHALIIQWDGFVLDAARWDPRFLDYDYIGAPWPQFLDGHNVGNGGFSLRSRRLMDACRDPHFVLGHPEDIAICRTNRTFLELKGLKFADRSLAERFSFERGDPVGPTFGFHGIFNLIPVLGADGFWDLYRKLDDRKTAAVDFGLLFHQLANGSNAIRRRLKLTIDYLAAISRW